MLIIFDLSINYFYFQIIINLFIIKISLLRYIIINKLNSKKRYKRLKHYYFFINLKKKSRFRVSINIILF